ncbi:uncharacterized protein LOC125216236 [Salvia hispanica]|uniref:uncharacterized protein LOC125216236 n=1 Tax=Salvia hispanica TaxID=49212 RepID=UPI0020096C11|nr:uncharacterized protein LOC125216236 [Salvia hispanica]
MFSPPSRLSLFSLCLRISPISEIASSLPSLLSVSLSASLSTAAAYTDRRRQCACTGGGFGPPPFLALPKQLSEATTVSLSSPNSQLPKDLSRLAVMGVWGCPRRLRAAERPSPESGRIVHMRKTNIHGYPR